MTPEDEIEMLKAENAVLVGYYKEAYDALDQIKSIVIGMGLHNSTKYSAKYI